MLIKKWLFDTTFAPSRYSWCRANGLTQTERIQRDLLAVEVFRKRDTLLARLAA